MAGSTVGAGIRTVTERWSTSCERTCDVVVAAQYSWNGVSLIPRVSARVCRADTRAKTGNCSQLETPKPRFHVSLKFLTVVRFHGDRTVA